MDNPIKMLGSYLMLTFTYPTSNPDKVFSFWEMLLVENVNKERRVVSFKYQTVGVSVKVHIYWIARDFAAILDNFATIAVVCFFYRSLPTGLCH